jgi:predicted PurR-regulated permease PerM
MNWSPAVMKSLAWLAVALVLGWLVGVFAPVLVPFVVAFAMAYVLHPLVERLVRWRLPRALAVTLALLVLVLAVSLLVLLVVPVVTKQLPLVRDQIPPMLEWINAQLVPLAAWVGVDVGIDVEAVREMLRTALSGHETDILKSLLNSAKVGGNAFMALLGAVVLMPVLAFYLLMDWDAVLSRAMEWVPQDWKAPVRAFARDVDATLGQYLRGQGSVMLALALWYGVALSLVGLQLAIPIGLFTGLAVFVPYLGFGLGLVMALMAALLQFQDWTGVLLVGAVYGAGQLIESFWLTPRLVGEAIGLNPIAVIFALMAFGHIMGFVGVLIALPASAVLLVALQRLKASYLSSDLYRT